MRTRRTVPPGPVGYDLHAPVLLLHTVQTAEAYGALCRDAVLRCPERVVEPEHEPAYRWMQEQYARRIQGAEGGRSGRLLWLWAQTTRAGLVGSLVEGCDRSQPLVLLTCRVPRERVLLSHFVDWHAVLNGTQLLPAWLPADEVEQRMEDFDRRHDADRYRGLPLAAWPPAAQAEIRASWEGVFDVAAYPRGQVWQATVAHVEAGEVTDVVALPVRRSGPRIASVRRRADSPDSC